MRILFLANEIKPFSNSHNIGEVCGDLPKSLKFLKHDIRVITPRYRYIRERQFGLREVARLKSLSVKFGDHEQDCSIKSGFLPKSKVQVYFIDNRALFHPSPSEKDSSIELKSSEEYLRSGFLCYSALELMLLLQWFPDIIHVNDWQTALVPYLSQKNERYSAHFKDTISCLQISGVSTEGVFSSEQLHEIGITDENTNSQEMQKDSKLTSILEIGLKYADRVVFSNKSTFNYFRKKSNKLTTNTNSSDGRIYPQIVIEPGIESQWCPESDPFIESNLTAENPSSDKEDNRVSLLKDLELEINLSMPIIAVFFENLDERGKKLFVESFADLSKLDAQWIFLSGSEENVNEFSNIIENMERKPVVLTELNKEKKHRIVAGSDYFLRISEKTDRCANPLYCLAYGTIPVVNVFDDSGSFLTETVDNPEKSNCVLIDDLSTQSVVDAISRSVRYFNAKNVWSQFQTNAIELDLTWSFAAEQLVNV
nr:glycogen/starch synthase [bacterium]